jgi:hypothetical protein
MRRRHFIAGIIGATIGRSVDVGACGDKFLRVGRSDRFARYAAVYPAAILIYSPINSTRGGIEEFKAFLKRAGHKPVALDRASSVPTALTASPYDVVIGDYLDADRLKVDLHSAASHAVLLPILHNASKAVEISASQQYPFLIKLQTMTKHDALAEIDRLMESRGRGVSARK